MEGTAPRDFAPRRCDYDARDGERPGAAALYFTSPVVHGMEPVIADIPRPAKRVMVFSSDGGRADRFFEVDAEGKPRAPFLVGKAVEKGTWGVSHTRVPTESRPGHVSMLAGIYEDMSAVTKGWQHNPVEFDSVINRSVVGFAFGSPDIVPMFVEHSPQVHAEWYDAAFEDFGTGEAGAMLLDEWVFNKSCTLFEHAAVNSTLASIMRTDGAIFFHHLLTLDSSGHVNKPYSPAYLANVARVDAGIRRVYEHAEAFFGPGNTAYLFTADHGMSNRGSHGDGQPVLTQTPIIAWGAGVPPPAHVSEEQLHWHVPPPVTDGFTGGGMSPLGPDVVVGWNDATPKTWGQLHELQRNDVAQADIAPLIAVLAGVPIPVNSVGRVPLPFLQVDASQAAAVVLANARQIWHMVCTKMQSRRDRVFFFSEFPGPSSAACADACLPDDVCGEAALARASQALSSGNVAEAKKLATQLIQGGLAACRWYETYDWPMLMCAVCLAYLGWAVFNLCAAGEDSSADQAPQAASTKFQRTVNVGVSLVSFVICALLLLQRHPWSYHAYVMFPLFLWRSIILSPPIVAFFRGNSKIRNDSSGPSHHKASNVSTLLNIILCAALIFVFIAGFFERSFYAGVALLCGLWPLLGARARYSHFPSLLLCRFFWLGSLLLSGLFAFLPVEGGDWPVACQVGGALCCAVGASAYALGASPKNGAEFLLALRKPAIILQILLCIIALFVLHSTNESLAAMSGLPLLNQILSWGASITALLLPALSPSNAAQRTASVVLGLTPGLILLSVSYEPLFLAFLFAAMCIWPLVEKLETEAAKDSAVESFGQALRPGTLSRKARLAVTYLSMCTLSFFGAGNVASVASFEISSTWRFVTVFSPFLMGGLLMYKVLGPMVVVGVAYRFSVSNAQCSTVSLLRVNMAECSLVALFFFFNVKQEGSWKDIGMSITHFIMGNLLALLTTVVSVVSSCYVNSQSSASEAKID